MKKIVKIMIVFLAVLMVTTDININAQQQVMVVFKEHEDQEYNDILKVTITPGTPVTKPQDPTRAGYEFKGWSYATDDNDQPLYWDFTQPVTHNLMLHAVWVKQVMVVFKEHEDQEYIDIPKVTITSGTPVSKPQDPTRAGYEFKGWSYATDDNDQPLYWDFTQPVTHNLMLHAVWVKQVVVGFQEHEDQEYNDILKVTITPGTPVTKPQDPTRAGYEFKGWSYATDDNDQPLYWDFTQPVTDNLMLHAVWVKQVIVGFQEYKDQEYNDIPKVTITSGTPVSKPQDPTRAGYEFKGWSYAIGANNQPLYWDFTQPVTDNLMLHAVWEKKTTHPVIGETVTPSTDNNNHVPNTGVKNEMTFYMLIGLGAILPMIYLMNKKLKHQ